ncbi:MAG: hypothetical protein E4H00_10570 [Myxococcales bacterium]|nr:MAG: hypothetical protein E4H00_10570 [Myxococcales bacterium]
MYRNDQKVFAGSGAILSQNGARAVTLRERWTAFSPRERYLVIGAGVVAVVVLVRYVPLPGRDVLGADAGEDSWVQLQKIESYRRILARDESAGLRNAELLARLEAAKSRLVPGSTPTQVGAALQGRLSQMASDAGLNVLSSQILKDDQVAEFRRVGVRMTLSGELDGVTAMLSSIETGPADLVVTLLEVNRKLGATRRPPIPSSRGTPTAAAAATLTATMEVKTYMQESL